MTVQGDGRAWEGGAARRTLLAAGIAALGLVATAQAAQPTVTLSPQGQVAEVRQFVARFSEPMVRTREDYTSPTLAVRCDGQPAEALGGQIHWVDGRTLVLDLDQPLPARSRCTLTLRPGLRAEAGAVVASIPSILLYTGAASLQRIIPDPRRGGAVVVEHQTFALQLTGNVDPAHLREQAHCRVTQAGVSTTVDVQPVSATERSLLAKALGFEYTRDRVAVFSCEQALPNDASVSVEWQPERVSPEAPLPPVDRSDFRVRAAFGVRFEAACGEAEVRLRRRGGSRCNAAQGRVDANGAVRVVFSRSIPIAQALRVRLETGAGERVPAIAELVRARVDPLEAPVDAIVFGGPFKPGDRLLARVPADLTDAWGASRADAQAALPPVVVAPGVVDAEGPVRLDVGPLGVRGRTADATVEADLALDVHVQGVRVLRVPAESRQDGAFDDRGLMRWIELSRRLQGGVFERRSSLERLLGGARVAPATATPVVAGRNEGEDLLATSALSVLDDEPAAAPARLRDALVATGNRRQARIALPGPGLQMVELAYDTPGDDEVASRSWDRGTALVTDLAVHVLLGNRRSLAWVTSLSTGRPVPGATVQVSDCQGGLIASGVSDAAGRVAFQDPQAGRYLACSAPLQARDGGDRFVSARVPLAGGLQDVAFAWSSWSSGFGMSERPPGAVGVDFDYDDRGLVHTFVGRSLLGPGQVVSMKHWLRRSENDDMGLPPRDQWPATLVLIDPAQQKFPVALQWSDRGDAQWQWTVPATARRGRYDVQMTTRDGGARRVATFEVRDFRVPEAEATLVALAPPWQAGRPGVFEARVRYLNGAAAVGLPVQLESVVESGTGSAPWLPAPLSGLTFDGGPGRRVAGESWRAGVGVRFDDEDDEDPEPPDPRPVPGPHQAATIDTDGRARFEVPTGAAGAVRRIQATLRFDDPDGEVRRVVATQALWPAAHRVGVRLQRLADGVVELDAGVVDLSGRAVAGAHVAFDVAVEALVAERAPFDNGLDVVHSRSTWRAVALPPACLQATGVDGRVGCRIEGLGFARVQADAAVTDDAGAVGRTHADLRRDDDAVWRASGWRSDALHVLPPVPAMRTLSLVPQALDVRAAPGVHRVGDVLQLKIRGHFDNAATLVSIERDGVLASQVVTLDGDDPTLPLTIAHRWMPGVFIGVQALQRGLDDMGQGRVGGRPAPGLLTGWEFVRVDTGPLSLAIRVTPESASVRVNDVARLNVAVTRADGRPAPANTRVALAVVNEALFALTPDGSRELEQLLTRQRWDSVRLASLQGRLDDASWGLPGGTAGGYRDRAPMQRMGAVQRVEITGSSIHPNAPPREPEPARLRSLFDTALTWLPDVTLTPDGTATVEIPTNDALARWRVVAVADASTDEDALLAGRAEAGFDTRQPLQLSAGLPPVLRTGDRSVASVAVRNDTDAAMRVRVTARAGARALEERRVDVPAQGRVDVQWEAAAVDAPGETVWEFAAQAEAPADGAAPARDRVQFRQRVLAAVPLTVREGTLVQVDRALALRLAPTDRAEAHVSVRASASLADGLPGIAEFFRAYRYDCLEQRLSRAIAQRDEAAWARIVADMPSYFDSSDLLAWFPIAQDKDAHGDVLPSAGGSDVLSSYVLSITAQARSQGLPFMLPPALQRRIVDSLSATARGVVRRDHGELAVGVGTETMLHRLAAIEALSRVDAAQPDMLDGVELDVRWPTASLIDLRNAVARLAGLPGRDTTLARIDSTLRSRLDVRGTRVSLVADRGQWTWMMRDADVDAVRIAMLAVDDPAWRDVAPRLLAGTLSRQHAGHWSTTVANALGTLLLADFAKHFESNPVAGTTSVSGAGAPAAVDWAATPAGATLDLPLPAQATPTLRIAHLGTGAPWVSVLESARVSATQPIHHGFAVRKTMTPLTPHPGGAFERGDVLQVHLDIDAQADATWVAVDDPVPGGATIVGASSAGQESWRRAAWVDKRFDRYQAFFERLPAGRFTIDYTLRLDTVGRFGMPATRVEAMYAPDMFGELPNATIVVGGQ